MKMMPGMFNSIVLNERMAWKNYCAYHTSNQARVRRFKKMKKHK